MTVIHGDALEVMRSMPSGSYDIVVTSPPYNLRTTTSGGFGPNSLWSQAREDGGLAGGYDGYSDDLPEREYEEWQNACVKEMLRLVRPRGGACSITTAGARRAASGRTAGPSSTASRSARSSSGAGGRA